VVLSRKLRAPEQPELAVGAVGEGGPIYLCPHARRIPGVTDDYLAQEREHQLAEIERRSKAFRAVRPAATVAGRSVIVTDDGIATGATMIAALEVLRHQHPRELIVAVPAAPPARLTEVGRLCDEVVCLVSTEAFMAVGQFYDRFDQVEDSEVVELLRKASIVAVEAS
jgi:predicted phosphoribosyltransferase